MAEIANNPVIKICLLGDPNVGKTSMLRHLQSLKSREEVTISAEQTAAVSIKLGNQAYRASVWDTAGQERFRSLPALYVRNAKALVLVFDITERNSFENLNQWMEFHGRAQSWHEPILVVVGNKIDLHQEREVKWEEGNAFAASINAKYWESSVLWAKNVDIIFETIIHDILRTQPLSRQPRAAQQILNLPNAPEKPSHKWCCGYR